MTRILGQHEAAVPTLTRRLDWSRGAMAGHSMGGHPASLLLGMQLRNPDTGASVNLLDTRIKVRLLLATPGSGGTSLTTTAAARYPLLCAG